MLVFVLHVLSVCCCIDFLYYATYFCMQ